MCECTCGNCTDPEMADMTHGLSRRGKLARDPDYGDWLYEQERYRELEKEPPIMLDEKGYRSIFDEVEK